MCHANIQSVCRWYFWYAKSGFEMRCNHFYLNKKLIPNNIIVAFEFTLYSSNRMRCFYHELTKLEQLAAPFRQISIWKEHPICKFVIFEPPIETKKNSPFRIEYEICLFRKDREKYKEIILCLFGRKNELLKKACMLRSTEKYEKTQQNLKISREFCWFSKIEKVLLEVVDSRNASKMRRRQLLNLWKYTQVHSHCSSS